MSGGHLSVRTAVAGGRAYFINSFFDASRLSSRFLHLRWIYHLWSTLHSDFILSHIGIETWINQGAIYNSCDDCNSEEATFANQIAPLISKNCHGCHSGPSPSDGILLTDHARIETQALNGQFLGVVNHSPGYTSMPFNLPRLDQSLIEQTQNVMINKYAA